MREICDTKAVEEWVQNCCNEGEDPIINFAWTWMIYWRPDKWTEGYEAWTTTAGVMAAARVLNLDVDKILNQLELEARKLQLEFPENSW